MSTLEPGTIAWAIAGDGCGPSDIGGITAGAKAIEAREDVRDGLGYIVVARVIGRKFSMLTILSTVHTDRRYADCRCDCGATVRRRLDAVVSGSLKSCGCLLFAKQVAS